MSYDRRYIEINPAMLPVKQCIGDYFLISNKGQDMNFNCLFRPKPGVNSTKIKHYPKTKHSCLRSKDQYKVMPIILSFIGG